MTNYRNPFCIGICAAGFTVPAHLQPVYLVVILLAVENALWEDERKDQAPRALVAFLLVE